MSTSRPPTLPRSTLAVLSRRTLIFSAAAVAACNPLAALSETLGSGVGERSDKFKADFEKLVGAGKPVEEKITVELPEIAENGNFVPITMTVESPMTDADHVKALHLLATENPVAHIATFRLRPANAVARVQSRIRLAKTQDVVVLAELSGGEILMSTTLVKVTIGGCAS